MDITTKPTGFELRSSQLMQAAVVAYGAGNLDSFGEQLRALHVKDVDVKSVPLSELIQKSPSLQHAHQEIDIDVLAQWIQNVSALLATGQQVREGAQSLQIEINRHTIKEHVCAAATEGNVELFCQIISKIQDSSLVFDAVSSGCISFANAGHVDVAESLARILDSFLGRSSRAEAIFEARLRQLNEMDVSDSQMSQFIVERTKAILDVAHGNFFAESIASAIAIVGKFLQMHPELKSETLPAFDAVFECDKSHLAMFQNRWRGIRSGLERSITEGNGTSALSFCSALIEQLAEQNEKTSYCKVLMALAEEKLIYDRLPQLTSELLHEVLQQITQHGQPAVFGSPHSEQEFKWQTFAVRLHHSLGNNSEAADYLHRASITAITASWGHSHRISQTRARCQKEVQELRKKLNSPE